MPLISKHTPSSTKRALLQRIPALADCDDRELAAIEQHVEETEIGEGAVLARQGTPGLQAFLIVEGQAVVTVKGEPVATLGPGELVGEMSMIDRGPRSATVVAKTPMKLLVIGSDAFDDVVATPAMNRFIRNELTGRLRSANEAATSD